MPVYDGEYLDYDEVWRRMDFYRPWLAKTYVSAMNTIHYMHDKYAYEKSQMSLHDTDVHRLMAFGIAGMSCMADSLSAIKYAKVTPIRDEKTGIITDFEIEGDFPKFGNDDDRVDSHRRASRWRSSTRRCKQFPLYRGADSYAVYTDDHLQRSVRQKDRQHARRPPPRRAARARRQPHAAAASVSGALASLNSVAKLSYAYCRDGISNTFSITPGALGKADDERVNQSGYDTGRLFRPEGTPPERKRAQSRDADGGV